MKKRILLIPLALLLAVSLVACAAPAPTPTPAPAATVTAPAATVTAPAATVTAPAVTVTAPAPTDYEKYVAGLTEGAFPVPREAFEQAQEEGQLNIYDWAGWWPEEAYEGFSEEFGKFGIKIVRDNFGSGDEVVAKYKLNPELRYDMVDGVGFSTTLRLIEIGALQELNYDWLPNVSKYMPEEYTQFAADPGAKYSVIAALGFNAYWYNTKYVDDPRIPSWAVVFEPLEKYKGRITLKDSMVKVIADALSYLGYRVDSDDEEELMEVKELLLKLKPYILAFDSWPKRLTFEEEAWISEATYGDAFVIHRDMPEIASSPPLEEGARLASEHLLIPKGAPHPAAAHLWINYIMRPRVNALLNGWIGNIPTNPAANEFLSQEYRDWVERIPEGYLEKTQVVGPKALTGRGLELREEIWDALKS